MQRRLFFLSFFGAGYAKTAPGTVGTIAGLPFAVLILYYFGAQTLLLCVFALSVIAIKEIDAYEADGDVHDDQRIVVDEVAGVSLALAMTTSLHNLFVQAILAFIFFRFFDITKLSIIGVAERKLKGGYAVMFDDLLAGLFAGLLILALYKAALLLRLV